MMSWLKCIDRVDRVVFLNGDNLVSIRKEENGFIISEAGTDGYWQVKKIVTWLSDSPNFSQLWDEEESK